jgi:hypothetical protein
MVYVLIGFVLSRTGFRFSKDYRYGVSLYHRIVYSLVNTVRCNQVADNLAVVDIAYRN